ncbi:GGDEF domain-containing protein [Cellulomonas endophytica]|uniref:GGDEF domain-containing protein n=1 Tax=Cellulomonas endophytica TaxID=2494735 RepID=UPI001010AA93|nr:GGDEF domain-containing protein [Cellulomonas endophytica]
MDPGDRTPDADVLATVGAGLARHPHDGLVVVEAVRDGSGRPVDVLHLWTNAAAVANAGRPLVGLRLREAYGEDSTLLPVMLDLLGTGRQVVTEVEYATDAADPGLHHRVFTVFLTAVGPDRVVCQYRDVSAERHAARRLEHLAGHDELTSLPNRRLAYEHLGRALARLDREGPGLAVMLGDLDGFKAVNDVHGHAAGDEVLVAVAADLLAAVRPHDVVARWGGDEFFVLCEGVERDAVDELVDRVCAAVTDRDLRGGGRASVRLSLGACWTDRPEGPDALVQRADERLYRAKRDRARRSS